jgi:uncharacterized ParB-like nuclease family protein
LHFGFGGCHRNEAVTRLAMERMVERALHFCFGGSHRDGTVTRFSSVDELDAEGGCEEGGVLERVLEGQACPAEVVGAAKAAQVAAA